MPTVQFHCPHCGGLFQIDPTFAGQYASCPLCLQVVALPPETGGEPPPPAPPPSAPPPPSDLWTAPRDVAPPPQFSCPVCGGLFQVAPEMQGQQVACPYCSSTMLLPSLSPPGALPPTSPPLGGYEMPAPPPEYVVRDEVPPPLPSFPPEEANVETLPPPSAAPRAAAMPEKPAPAKRVERPKPIPAAPKGAPKRQPPSPARTDLPATEAEDLLPPTISRPLRQPPGTVASAENAPEATPSPTPQASAEQGKRGAAGERPSARRSGTAADGSVLIPTEGGGYMALREPIKTVEVRGREVELRRLTPEEKAQRRFKRNLLVAGCGLLFLIVAMLALGFLRGGF